MKKIRSIRVVLTVFYTTLLLVAFALFGGSVYLYLQHLLETRLDRNLIEEVDWIAQICDLERSRLNGRTSLDSLSQDIEYRIDDHFSRIPRNYIVMLTTLQGGILYESDDRGEFMLGSFEQVTTHVVTRTVDLPARGSLRVAGKRSDPFLILVGDTEEGMQDVLENLISIFSVLAPVMLFAAIAGGWLMAGIILRPIRQITSMANRISAENLNQRIPERNVDDELGTLIATMNRMIERLHASFEEMKQFSMNVAHELKTPLTIMKGESELALARNLSREEMENLITSYLEETVRMSRIVDDLLTLAKADSGQIIMQKQAVQLDAMIRELHEDAIVLSMHKRLIVALEKVDPAVVEGDASRLRQLFRILLTNAVQYTEEGGSIRLACETRDGSVFVALQDSGIGIPADSIDKIFHRFYRVDKARTRVKGGSGLGLSLAQWIVRSHHGTITVTSQPGKGSCFTVQLPLLHTDE